MKTFLITLLLPFRSHDISFYSIFTLVFPSSLLASNETKKDDEDNMANIRIIRTFVCERKIFILPFLFFQFFHAKLNFLILTQLENMLFSHPKWSSHSKGIEEISTPCFSSTWIVSKYIIKYRMKKSLWITLKRFFI